jgi:putative transposase
MDSTRTDIVVIDDEDLLPFGKLTLTWSLDAATRYPLGLYLGFEPESYLSVKHCLYHTICNKADVRERYGTQHDWVAFGTPFELMVDRAKAFKSKHLRDACRVLGIGLQFGPPRTPVFRAGVERLFETTNTGTLHMLPGTTFSDPRQRGDYESLKQACISMEELDRILHIWVVDIYAHEYHRGLKGIPAQRWEAMLEKGYYPRVPASSQELNILLGAIEHRTIQPYGIEWETMYYNSPDLRPVRLRMERMEDRQVLFKYDPGDLGRIWVFDPFEKEYIEAPAKAQNYACGLSLWKHRVIRRYALHKWSKVNIGLLAEAQRLIQSIVQESTGKVARGRRRIARWKTGGQRAGAGESAQAAESNAPSVETVDEPVVAPVLTQRLDLADLERAGWGVSN